MQSTILILAHHYLPGYKAGGPIRSIANIVDRLGDKFDFKIITSDRDLGDTQGYPGLTTSSWEKVGKAQVMYLPQRELSYFGLLRVINETEYDLIYINSYFDFYFAISPLVSRRFTLRDRKPTVLAPRGEFSPGALTMKWFKKMAYVRIANALGLTTGVTWQVSSAMESDEIRRLIPINEHAIQIAQNLTAATVKAPSDSLWHPHDCLHIVFLSRISKKKNLNYALRVLKKVTVVVEFEIYGPIEDSEYWQECLRIIDCLPPNVTVCYRGAVESRSVAAALRKADLFFLPTLGENFGHVIAESLGVGTTVLLSDTTPWLRLKEMGLGYAFPLKSQLPFIDAIHEMSHQSRPEADAKRSLIQRKFLRLQHDSCGIENHVQLFKCALGPTS